jgi:hypothetical protein
VSAERVEVRLSAAEGAYAPPRERVHVELRGVRQPRAISVDDRAADFEHEGERLLVRLATGGGHLIQIER